MKKHYKINILSLTLGYNTILNYSLKMSVKRRQTLRVCLNFIRKGFVNNCRGDPRGRPVTAM